MNTTTTPKNDLPRAFRALRALFADPDDLPQVFTILESLPGTTLPKMERRMRESATGRGLLANRPDVVALLQDREALRKLPEGSLGRAYLAFVESENISAEGIRDADSKGRRQEEELDPTLAFLHQRMRDTHDMWHAVTGYRGDVLGEAALLAFNLAQSFNVGIALIVGLGLTKTIGAPEARRLILDGYLRGRRAEWLPAVAWEELLARPVDEVRRSLRVGPPPAYTPVRSAELKAARGPTMAPAVAAT
jgi:ubiquinone biosynthesis protein COQ4